MSEAISHKEEKAPVSEEKQEFKLADAEFLDQGQFHFLKAEAYNFSSGKAEKDLLLRFVESLWEKRVLKTKFLIAEAIEDYTDLVFSKLKEKTLTEDYFKYLDKEKS